MEALVHQGKSLVLILVKQTQNFAWVYINGKEIFKFKADNNIKHSQVFNDYK